jgi:hypothetical protein
MQGKTRPWNAKSASRDAHNMRSVQLGDNGSLQTDARETCTLSRMFPESRVTDMVKHDA